MAEPTVDETRALLRTEATTILDFVCGPIKNAAAMPVMSSWMNGMAPVSVTDHTFMVMLIALSMHQLCRERDIMPFANVDGTRIVLQALTSSTLNVNNLFAVEFPDNPLIEELRGRIEPVVIKEMVKPLAPCIATIFEQAWLCQLTNEQNPLSQLIQAAEYTALLLYALDSASVGNQNALRSCQTLLTALITLSGKMDTDLKCIVEGITNLISNLLGITPDGVVDESPA